MAKKSETNEVSAGAVLAEYVGTFSLAFAVLASINGVLVSFVPTPVVAAFTLFIAVLTIGSISGAHINPGVTVGLYSIRQISLASAAAYIIAQVAGAFSAAAVMEQLLDGALLTLVAGETDVRIFLGEMIGMIFFGFGIAAAVSNKYKGVDAAAVVGGSLFLGIMFASIVSNGLLNPAIAFAVDSVSVVYLLAPLVGAVLGMNLYTFIKRQV